MYSSCVIVKSCYVFSVTDITNATLQSGGLCKLGTGRKPRLIPSLKTIAVPIANLRELPRTSPLYKTNITTVNEVPTTPPVYKTQQTKITVVHPANDDLYRVTSDELPDYAVTVDVVSETPVNNKTAQNYQTSTGFFEVVNAYELPECTSSVDVVSETPASSEFEPRVAVHNEKTNVYYGNDTAYRVVTSHGLPGHSASSVPETPFINTHPLPKLTPIFNNAVHRTPVTVKKINILRNSTRPAPRSVKNKRIQLESDSRGFAFASQGHISGINQFGKYCFGILPLILLFEHFRLTIYNSRVSTAVKLERCYKCDNTIRL